MVLAERGWCAGSVNIEMANGRTVLRRCGSCL
jgi:hypothetical protein